VLQWCPFTVETLEPTHAPAQNLDSEGRAQKQQEVPNGPPLVVQEEEALLAIVLQKIDQADKPERPKARTDDFASMIELRDAMAEAKLEDQASLLEQMHRIEALSKQRGKGKSGPIDRKSPYFGHLRLEENGKRRDVLIGQRGFVEPGGGVQIVDWRNAPVSRLFYRYDEGDAYEEKLGNRDVEGEILARRTVTILDSRLRRVTNSELTYARDQLTGNWREINTKSARLRVERDGRAELTGGWPAKTATDKQKSETLTRGRLGVDSSGERRSDKFLPSIAALIDPRQFELISRPTSGLIVVQGSAGSGKTTIGLHRIAYLSFTDPRRFSANRMLIVVYQRALATYVSRVLPSLDVPGVPVMTFASWAEKMRAEVLPAISGPLCENTPSSVVRAKSHGAMLHMIDDAQQEIATWCRQELETFLRDRASLCRNVLALWDSTKGPVDARVTQLARWSAQPNVDAVDRSTIESVGKRLRVRTRDVVAEWARLLTDRAALAAGLAKYASSVFTEGQIDSVHKWCVERERIRINANDGGGMRSMYEEGEEAGDEDRYALDPEDDALLLRIHQQQRGPLANKNGPIQYEHLMIDEVQDFAPVELAVLLDSTTSARSITLAGDTAQAIAPEHGFSRWSDMLDDLGIPHDRVEPLRVSYRSTREIVDCAEHVLGHLGGDVRPVAPRSGAPVEAFGFSASGEACEFLAQALKELIREEPTASVAVIARHPEQARMYYEVLSAADVPRLRLVSEQDFSFTPGIDITDVRQTKGLEFDIVILLECTEESYPDNDLSRRLLHVAMTRGAHQLWITYSGSPSRLMPEPLRA